MALPIFVNDNKDFGLMQTAWASALNPVVDLPTNHGVILKSVKLVTGINQIDHRLRRKLQGWMIVRQRAAATFFDDQDNNKFPEMFLRLNASAPVTVDLFVF